MAEQQKTVTQLTEEINEELEEEDIPDHQDHEYDEEALEKIRAEDDRRLAEPEEPRLPDKFWKEEFEKNAEELTDYRANTKRTYYILKECTPGHESRVNLKQLGKFIPLAQIRQGKLESIKHEAFHLPVTGKYFPDFLEASGVYLFSIRFLEDYLKYHVYVSQEMEFQSIGLVNEAQRMEEYRLVLPPQYDAIIPESIRYNQAGELVYFELDESKLGEADFFTLKGFPHLLVTVKLNRVCYAGYECPRIEDFFDYEGKRDQDYQARLSGVKLREAVQKAEAKLQNAPAALKLVKTCAQTEAAAAEFRSGLAKILESFQGEAVEVVNLEQRALRLRLDLPNERVVLEEHQAEFGCMEFKVKALCEQLKQIKALLPELQLEVMQVWSEKLLSAAIKAGSVLEDYPKVHQETRMRIYLSLPELPTTNHLMIYDYKSEFQKAVEQASDLRQFELNGKDLREFDLRGKNLVGLKLSESNLRKAKFDGSNLSETEFKRCNLIGASFVRSNLTRINWVNNRLELNKFDYANLTEAKLVGSNLWQCSFIRSNLERALLKNYNFNQVYFYQSRLFDTVLQFEDYFDQASFVLADLRGAKICGIRYSHGHSIDYCDFRNADLTGATLAGDNLYEAVFTQALLSGTDLRGCGKIYYSIFRYAKCPGLKNDDDVSVWWSDFTRADLSEVQTKEGMKFLDCDLSFANFSRYKFSKFGLSQVKLVYTDLTNANLSGLDLREDNELIYPKILGAYLQGTIFREEQLKYIELDARQRKMIVINNTIDEEE